MESCSSAKGKLEVRSSSDEVVIDADARGGCTTYESDDAAASVATGKFWSMASFVPDNERTMSSGSGLTMVVFEKGRQMSRIQALGSSQSLRALSALKCRRTKSQFANRAKSRALSTDSTGASAHV